MRRGCRWLHRHCSFLFAGVVLIYALSGILMNHRDQINPSYTAKRIILQQALPDTPRAKGTVTQEELTALLSSIGEEKNYTKHYYPDDGSLKVFLKGGSTLEVDLSNGTATYDRLRKRPILSDFVRLHYNPGRWWTYFSDLFAVALILITLSGLLLVKGKRGLKGIGGVELIIGIVIPLLFLWL
ncbi:PepSY-associated TM helix domain-containing protein [uncultured Porphyromonas sp.]|uniref:PepSY-associated TM helix domain-containing protein n=1 Tax=uncultured Porphyromonas sp. TaxID=159274 RepID=UPI002621A646|nr:PepSY-associated TM helix domain-containing protein [uncultured Porphyromonas sp.]